TLTNNGKGYWIGDDTTAAAYTGTLTLSGDSISTSGAQSSIFNDSATPVTATNETFNTVLASGATTAQQYAIVDTILDGVDVGGAGFVRTNATNVYVTANSFSNSSDLFIYGPTTTPSVQRGINVAAASGDTVHI